MTCMVPGSFDPVTTGHMDIITRAARLYEDVIVTVLHNMEKKTAFSMQERRAMIERATQSLGNVRVDTFSGLLVDYAHSHNVRVIVKGLRRAVDFEYEYQLAAANRHLDSSIETVLLMTDTRYNYLSSTLVRDLAAHGGDITGLVPDCIKEAVISGLAKGASAI